MFDCIVIGSGPAGISSALYMYRANLNILIISEDKSALKSAKQIDNFYGSKSISGAELYQKGIEQAKALGIEFVNAEVLNVKTDYEEQPTFYIYTMDKVFEARTVVLATGATRALPKVANLPKYKDKNISFCAVCDGFFYRNKPVYVLGYTDYAIEEAKELKKVSNQVTILTNGKDLKTSEDIKIDQRIIKKFKGDNLEQIEFEDETIDVSGLFIAWETPGGIEFAKKLGLEINDNKLVVNQKMETNLKGIYACGDITGSPFQIAKAIYEGMIAGMTITKYLKQKK